ncbi:hypothetical protein [Marinifilum fragile]|uniref:hypothetical protein n=1 Tax=Marinifilum fragile TaxID=570161 RepID=UPI002AABDBC0|nr:hypothetical protein [Marinifilum fragile]
MFFEVIGVFTLFALSIYIVLKVLNWTSGSSYTNIDKASRELISRAENTNIENDSIYFQPKSCGAYIYYHTAIKPNGDHIKITYMLTFGLLNSVILSLHEGCLGQKEIERVYYPIRRGINKKFKVQRFEISQNSITFQINDTNEIKHDFSGKVYNDYINLSQTSFDPQKAKYNFGDPNFIVFSEQEFLFVPIA